MTRRTGADATGRWNRSARRSRPRGMTIRGALRPAAAVAVLLGLRGLRASAAATGDTGPATATVAPAAAEALVLRAEYTGGFVSPSVTAARLPLVSVYADGRVITEGPVAAIYPGPGAAQRPGAATIDRARVQDLVDQALAAGVAETADLGIAAGRRRPVHPVHRRHGRRTYVREVYALSETPRDGTAGSPRSRQAARAKLSDLLDDLDRPRRRTRRPAPYVRPTAVAAIATPVGRPGGRPRASPSRLARPGAARRADRRPPGRQLRHRDRRPGAGAPRRGRRGERATPWVAAGRHPLVGGLPPAAARRVRLRGPRRLNATTGPALRRRTGPVASACGQTVDGLAQVGVHSAVLLDPGQRVDRWTSTGSARRRGCPRAWRRSSAPAPGRRRSPRCGPCRGSGRSPAAARRRPAAGPGSTASASA